MSFDQFLHHVLDDGEELAGAAIEAIGHALGGAADALGLHDAAQTIDQFADAVGDRLGATPAEKNLGDTGDPTELIHGAPNLIGDVVARLGAFADGFGETGTALRGIDTGGWTGDGAAAFEAVFQPHQALWGVAATATGTAKSALAEYNQTLTWAQSQAAQAIAEYNQAVQAATAEVDAYNQTIETYNNSDRTGPRPAPYEPSAGLVERFQAAAARLTEARRQRNAAAGQAAGALQQATATAPEMPSLADRLSADVADLATFADSMRTEFGAGVVDAAAGLVQLARTLNPLDLHNLTHPAEFAEHVVGTAAGLFAAAGNPVDLGKALIGSGWSEHPGQALGNLVGNVGIGLLTGGAGDAGALTTRVGADVAETAVRQTAVTATADLGDSALAGAARTTADSTAADLLDETAVRAPESAADTAARPPDTAVASADGAQPAVAPDRLADPQPADSAGQTDSAGDAIPEQRANAPEPQTSGTHADAGPAEPSAAPDRPADPQPTDAAGPANSAGDAVPEQRANAPEPQVSSAHAEPPTDASPANSAGDAVPAQHTTAPEPQSSGASAEPLAARSTDVGGQRGTAVSSTEPAGPAAPTAAGATETGARGAGAEVPGRAGAGASGDVARADAAGRPSAGMPERVEAVPRTEAPAGERAASPAAEARAESSVEPSATDPHPHPEGPVDAGPADVQQPQAHPPADTGSEHPANSEQDLGARDPSQDPVDLASGEVLWPDTDLDLPGVLPLRLSRLHVSSYRAGRGFGRRWASSLDQRVETKADAAIVVAEDAALVRYRHAPVGRAVAPENGAATRYLTRTERGGYRLDDPRTGLAKHYHRAPGLALPGGVYPLVAITDRHQNRILFEHNHFGVVTAISHTGGYRVEVASDAAGRVTGYQLVDPTAPGGRVRVRGFDYDDRGRLVGVLNGSGLPFRFDYDDDDRLTGWTDRNGYRFGYRYDRLGRCVGQRGADGSLDIGFDYRPDPDNPGGTLTAHTDSLGHTTYHRVDASFQITAVTDPLGATRGTAYDAARRPLVQFDPLGRAVQYRYTADGDLAGIRRPDGAETALTYHAPGLPATVREFDGREWAYGYTAAGDVATVTDPTGAVTAFDYDARGARTAVTNPLGARHRFEPTPAGLPAASIDPRGNAVRYRYDAFGRIVAVTDGLGNEVRLTWSADGNLVRREHPDGAVESWTYDGENNLLAHTDPVGATTRYTYGPFDRVTSRTDPDATVTRYRYDTQLQLVAVTNPQDLTWSYTYTAAGKLAAETDFDGRQTSYRHDRAGQLLSFTNGVGQTVEYTYNQQGLVDTIRGPDTATRYDYDAAGRVVRAENPDAVVEFVRDPLGRITAESVNAARVTSTFDAAGQRTARRTPAGVDTSWHYNELGRVGFFDQAGHRVSSQHDAAGREISRNLAAGLDLDLTWTARGRLARQTVRTGGRGLLNLPGWSDAAAPGTILDRGFAYRADNALTAVADGHGERNYRLDSRGRVTAVRAADRHETYSYDRAGNLATASPAPADPAAPEPATRAYQGTRLAHAGPARYHYDGQNRLVRKTVKRLSRKPESWHYTWDSNDQLREVRTPDGTRWTYRYDPFGRRIGKLRTPPGAATADAVTVFTWDGDQLVEQRDGDGHTTWTYDPVSTFTPVAEQRAVRGAESPDAIDRRFYAIVTDMVGTPTELLDVDTGEVVGAATATLWNRTSWTGDTGTPLRLPGQYFDAETGLHYNRFRYYDPDTGRYIGTDPLGLEPAPNPVAYAHNPTGWIDPLGLSSCPHRATVDVYDPDGNLKYHYPLRSGDELPQEAALGFPNSSMASHTEARSMRIHGASPTVPIPGDPLAGIKPVTPGDHIVIDGTKPPCPQCKGAMNRAVTELGVDVTYRWGGKTWRAGGR